MIFNNWNFLGWVVLGVFHSFLVFIIPWGCYQENILKDDAYNNDMWSFSVASFTAVILIVTFKLMFIERYFTWINFVSIFCLSLLIYFIYIWGSNFTGFSSTFYSMRMIFTTHQYYLPFALITIFCFLLDMFIALYHFEIKENPVDYLRKKIANKEEIFEDD